MYSMTTGLPGCWRPALFYCLTQHERCAKTLNGVLSRRQLMMSTPCKVQESLAGLGNGPASSGARSYAA